MTFVDRVVLHVAAGAGGNGCASVRREKYKPLGGPDGGSGGRGGDVVLVVDPSVTTLLDYHRRPHRSATSGRPGQGSLKAGADGEDLELPVPDGTVVSTADGRPLADLVGAGTRYVVAAGGRGGLGNAALASPRRKAPGFALLGEPGESGTVVLELKTIADVALVGFPNAGKSSLIAAVSAARPKVADYPFTTLVPNLGVVQAGDTVFTMADVPGLVPGASQGKGLGLQFLRHVERCSVLLQVVDCASDEPGREPERDLDAVEQELAAYGGLSARPRIVALNKVDVTEARRRAERAATLLRAAGHDVHLVSAATHEGLRELTFAVAAQVAAARASAPVAEPYRTVLRPVPLGGPEFDVHRDGDTYVVRGAKPERWVAQTDFGNDEAVGYLADRLARLGVEDALTDLGAHPGAEVRIADVTFDWQPAVVAGRPHAHGRRGSDPRLDQS